MREPPEIHKLGLSRRAFNVLFRSGINTIPALESLSYTDLLSMPGVGVNIAYEITHKLQHWKKTHP